MSDMHAFDMNPLTMKTDRDLRYLCYLGLHQYAKENKLIGRSRPMITDDMTDYYISRLFFRLTVACIKQLIGTTYWDHGGDKVEQVNYLNVNGYKTLRLYGLLDRDLFIQDGRQMTYGRRSRQSYWIGRIPAEDMEWLVEPLPSEAIYENLSIQSRALFDTAGDIFAGHYRTVARSLPEDRAVVDMVGRANNMVHLQWDPSNASNIKNVAINLDLYERKYSGSNLLHIPVHIERIVYFRNVLMPWIQLFQDEELKESYRYCIENYPLQEVVNDRIRTIQNSDREVRRQQEREEAATESRENELEHLRERMRVHFGRGAADLDRDPDELVPHHGIVQLTEGEAPPEDAQPGTIVLNARGDRYYRLSDHHDWLPVPRMTCQHCEIEVGPLEGDQCECEAFTRMWNPPDPTILDEHAEEDACYLCGEHYNECMCCGECENHIDECTCDEPEEPQPRPQPDVHYGQLTMLADVHERLRAPQAECPCAYCTGYRAGEGETDGN